MTIAIIGAGNVGMALARAFTQRGESVVLGVPEPAKYVAATASPGPHAGCRLAQLARVVRAFNSTGAENMADTAYPGCAPFMPVCGDDAQARAKVVALAAMIGFDAVDCGDLTAARYIEPFAMTWIHMALRLGLGRRFAFARLQR